MSNNDLRGLNTHTCGYSVRGDKYINNNKPVPDSIGYNTKPIVVIYTDGSCHPNPGPGGWASLLMYDKCDKNTGEVINKKKLWLYGCDKRTTNNRMEMLAVIKALEKLRRYDLPVIVHSDSMYVLDGAYSWSIRWKKEGWTNRKNKKTGGKIINLDLWQRLDAIKSKFDVIQWQWVRGHNGDKYNTTVDEIALSARAEMLSADDSCLEKVGLDKQIIVPSDSLNKQIDMFMDSEASPKINSEASPKINSEKQIKPVVSSKPNKRHKKHDSQAHTSANAV